MENIERISFVIPCYGSELTLMNVINEIDDTMKERANEYTYEIVLINDHSPDNVWSVIENLAKNRKNIKGISFSKNFGQHSALMAGYRACTGDIIVTLDDDGQTPACETFSLVSELKKGYDVVFASYKNTKQPLWRKIGSLLDDKMATILIKKPKDIKGNSFFVMKSFVAKEMIKYENSYPYIGGLIYRVTKSITNVNVSHRERQNGKSGYTLFNLIKLWMNGFTAFSIIPLRVSSFIGVLCAFIGFLFGVITIIRKLIVPDIQVGWTSTIAILLFVGGLIMLMLGIIGEYIGRIYISINNAPQYVVKQTINLEDTDDAKK